MALARTFRTVRHLKPVQIGNRLGRKVRRRRPSQAAPPPRRSLGVIAPQIDRRESILANGEIMLLDRSRIVAALGDWNDPAWPKLWLYNLHYHDGLRAASTPEARKRAFVEQWIAQNPVGHGNGWEPYPLSLRIVNWIGWTLAGGELGRDAVASLAVQLRALENSLEYHLLGNHLWANAKALVFGGLFFEGAEADRWLRTGRRIADAQLREQFLADGGHFELSPSYHATMVEDLLDIVNLAGAARHVLPRAWRDTASAALRWLTVMTRGDGRTPLFNDAFHDVAPSTSDLLAYADRLGIASDRKVGAGLTGLAASGYHRWDGDGFSAWVDFGRIGPDYIPGHAHADCFGFELFADSRPLIVDTGVSTYEVGPRRDYERGTAAHNTVEIAGLDQAEMWAGFRVGRRPDVLAIEITADGIGAEHSGYDWIGARHRRRFDFGPDEVRIEDVVRWRGGARAPAAARLHFAPDAAPALVENGIDVGGWEVRIDGVDRLSLESCQVAESFNRLRDALCLRADFTTRLTTRIARCRSSS